METFADRLENIAVNNLNAKSDKDRLSPIFIFLTSQEEVIIQK
jgi:hypothetical protein